MTTGYDRAAELRAQYLEKARVPYLATSVLRHRFKLLIVAWMVSIFLPASIADRLFFTTIGIFIVAMMTNVVVTRRAENSLEVLRWALYRQINPYGGLSHDHGWNVCHVTIGRYDFFIDYWRYAKSDGTEGVRCRQFPELTGTLRSMLEEISHYGQQLQHYLPKDATLPPPRPA